MPKFLVLTGEEKEKVEGLLKSYGIRPLQLIPGPIPNSVRFEESVEIGLPVSIRLLETFRGVKVVVNDRPLSEFVSKDQKEKSELLKRARLLLYRLSPMLFWSPKSLRRAREALDKCLTKMEGL